MEENIGSDLASLNFDFLSEESVPCILCHEIFVINDDNQELLKHLMNIHKFLIENHEEIADFRHYVLYWKKLQSSRLEKYCIVYITNTEPNSKEVSETYYLLSDKLPEDKFLRTSLRQMKLNFLTHQKEEECQNKNFSRPCIYCSTVIGGGVAKSFSHLTFDHGFSLGNPNNIVFGSKLLDLMEDKLTRMQCLYCEKIFKNHLTLREHMRKKQHRSLNPKNKQYDKFYLINYLKPGVPWEEAKKIISDEERESKSLSRKLGPTDIEDDPSDDEQLWMDWREDDGGVSAVCLFCPFTTAKTPVVLFHHMEVYHHFKFEELTKNLNFYSKVKLINYIRMQAKNGSCLMCNKSFDCEEDLFTHGIFCTNSHLPPQHVWDDPVFLIPVLENDGLLIHLEDNDVEDEDSSSIASSLNEEIVLPEDAVALPSILSNWKLLEELSEEGNNESKLGFQISCPTKTFKCFFCSFTLNGNQGESLCINHMNSIHSFNYKDSFKDIGEEEKEKIICCMRTLTEMKRCYICEKHFMSNVALEEHRILEGHVTLPPKWLYNKEGFKSAPPNEGFLQLKTQNR